MLNTIGSSDGQWDRVLLTTRNVQAAEQASPKARPAQAAGYYLRVMGFSDR